MALRKIPVDRVVVGDRLRQTNKDQVSRLVDSIREAGLINPITVGEETEEGYPLVAGLHRLEACISLGLTEIDANVVELPELRRQLMEVDENLVHSFLTVAQRAIFTARRKELYLALHPETANGGDRRSEEFRSKRFPSETERVLSFSEETARRTGRCRRVVDMDAQRGATIPHDVLETVSGSDLGRTKSLNLIMRMMPDQQQELCEHIRAGRLIEARQMVDAAQYLKVVQLPGNCTKEVRKQMERVMRNWDMASDEARRRILAKLEKKGHLRKYGPGPKIGSVSGREGA